VAVRELAWAIAQELRRGRPVAIAPRLAINQLGLAVADGLR